MFLMLKYYKTRKCGSFTAKEWKYFRKCTGTRSAMKEIKEP